MSNRSHASWHVPGDVAGSINRAVDQDVYRPKIIDLLAAHEFSDVERERVEAVVEQSVTHGGRTGTSVERSAVRTDENPREAPSRSLTVDDIEYLSETEFARLLGVVLSQFEGTSSFPSVRDGTVDFYWNRQHTTVGVRTVIATDDKVTVGTTTVESIADGNVSRRNGRSPSTVALVTNGTFTDEAVATADRADIELFDGSMLAAWLDAVQLSISLAGDVLEHATEEEYDLEDRIDKEPTLPKQVRARDPLTMQAASPVEPGDEGGVDSLQEGSGGLPVRDVQPGRGEFGRLYADPADDGDYSAFDRFEEGLSEMIEKKH